MGGGESGTYTQSNLLCRFLSGSSVFTLFLGDASLLPSTPDSRPRVCEARAADST